MRIGRSVLAAIASLLLVACSSGPATNGAGPSPVPSGGTSTPASPTPHATPSDARTWVQVENAQTGGTGWRLGARASDTDLAGFASRAAIDPGESFTLKVTSTASTWHAEAWRMGWYGGAGGRLVWTSGEQQSVRQPAPKVLDQHMVSAAHWSAGPTVETTGWPAGSYLLKLVDDRGRQKYVPLTVRSTDFTGRLLMLSATSTYQAYNTYGGYSLYKGPTPSDPRASRVSFERPYDQDGARFALGYERPLVELAEKMGLDLAYATSSDLEQGAARFAGLVGLVSPGHDEYWSVPMRTTVEALRDKGTNLAFMGANSVYWRIRFEHDAREVVSFKFDTDPTTSGPTATNLWRDYRSEASLVGQLYECFPAHGDMVVRDPDFFAFAGTGATRGSSYPGLVGVEIDRAYPAGISPANLQVVAHSPVQCAQLGGTFSDMTWYSTPSGAGVFAVGTMDWRSGVGAASVPTGMTAQSVAFATRVTQNVLRTMAEPLAGRAHPPRPNLAEIAPPARTSTGTGGAVKGR